ncbi:toluene transporter auxiliary component Ttg2D [Acetobacter estunensis NRIC 0472]|uniref:ABC transporter substrate-binding protein n=1 Tax=Acetobacter estunensis TaxID=104097 RepID=A0A967BC63_9PROT|nr:ABC transporter substrate-binding protein [Acetobacter estunensis]MBV1837241.1 ABC transporter substrate-binding protein [Acetobacter estunensis]NHO53687.1 ABC transporter substrate-binding protein [Acetobacter estunensis]GBQ25232.1 toluene transporter auxiliary component Ttg2D [Acetobacter estunensis NRIC 0472]
MTIRASRRSFVLGTAAAAALLPVAAFPALAAQPAAEFVRSLGNRLVAIVNSNLSPDEKKAHVLPILQSDVDVDAIGRYCLGRYWRMATPEQQTEYLSLFHQVLVNAITDKLGDYRGVSFTIGTTTPQGEDQAVAAVLHRPQQPDAAMQWIVSTQSGSPKIVDVIGEGASLRLTQRQDYSAYIQRNGGQVATLLAALKRQLAHHQTPSAN